MTELWIVLTVAGLVTTIKRKWHWLFAVTCIIALIVLVFGTHAGRSDVGSIVTFVKAVGTDR